MKQKETHEVLVQQDMESARRKHEPSNEQDVVICCRHSNNVFTETNGLLTDLTCNFFCENRLNYLSRAYMFVCVRCLKNLQTEVVTLYDLNNNWSKHYIDHRDVKQIHLNAQYRFLSVGEVNASYYFSNNPYLIEPNRYTMKTY